MINEALRLFRIYNDLKLYELAEKLELSQSYLSEIEKGKKSPNLKVLNKYANYFGIPTSALFQFAEKLEDDAKGIKSSIAKNIISFLKKIENNGS